MNLAAAGCAKLVLVRLCQLETASGLDPGTFWLHKTLGLSGSQCHALLVTVITHAVVGTSIATSLKRLRETFASTLVALATSLVARLGRVTQIPAAGSGDDASLLASK